MKYIKYKDFTGKLNEDEILLMSHDEFVSGGKDFIGVPVCITPDGNEPVEQEEFEHGMY
jgi:hypothetical protein